MKINENLEFWMNFSKRISFMRCRTLKVDHKHIAKKFRFFIKLIRLNIQVL